jgi:hypothetical protein
MGETRVWPIDKYYGGFADGSKRGIQGAFKGGRGLDLTTDPDVLTALKRLKKDSGSVVTGLPKWMKTHLEDIWAYDENGELYKKSSGSWSNPHTASNSSGNGLEVFDDFVYYAQDETFGRYGPLSGTPTFEDDFLSSSDGEADNTQVATVSNTYTTPTFILEAATDKATFASGSDVDNITGISVLLVTKGTGNLTLTLHDSSNNIIAKKTIANADMADNTTLRFNFSGAQKISPSTSYHFHITSTVADATIRTNTANDLSDAAYTTFRYYSPEDFDQTDGNQLEFITDLATQYSFPTAIDEDPTHRQTFIPDKSNLVAISFLVEFRGGSSNIKLTVHDEDNNTIASKTVVGDTSLSQHKAYSKIEFDNPVKVVPGATYHFHITTSSGGTVFTNVNNDLEGSGFITHYQILNNDEWHPMLYFPGAQAMVIGNENFVAVYDGIIYRTSGQAEGSERLKLAKEEKVRGFALVGDYLAIATWKGGTVGDDPTSNLYFWDGTSSTYNAFKPVTGEVNAIWTGDDGLLYVIHGGFGFISIYDGGLTLVQTIPLLGENKTMEVYPGAITNWNGQIHFGISDGDSATVERGIYSYGRKTNRYPRALNFAYPISTGTTTGTGIQIGSVLGVGPSKLFVGWKDDSSYGIDIVDIANDQPNAIYETLIFDAGQIYQEKKGIAVKLNFLKLKNGDTITLKYKIDREATWQAMDPANASFAIDGALVVKSFPFDKRFRELQLQVTLSTTGFDAPTLLGIATYFEIIGDIQEKQ